MTEPIGGPPAAPPPPTTPGGRPGNPWDRRDELGYGNAFLQALKQFVVAPGEAFASTRESGDFAGPLMFAVAIGWIAAIIGQVWSTLFGASMLQFLPAELSEEYGALMVGSGLNLVAWALLAPIFIVIGLLIWSVILHVCVMIVGGLGASRAGFEGTFRAVAFSSVAQLGSLIPLVGGLISFVWSIVLLVMGISSLHRTTQGKALFAVLIPFILCCVCFGIGAFMFGATIAAFMSGQAG